MERAAALQIRGCPPLSRRPGTGSAGSADGAHSCALAGTGQLQYMIPPLSGNSVLPWQQPASRSLTPGNVPGRGRGCASSTLPSCSTHWKELFGALRMPDEPSPHFQSSLSDNKAVTASLLWQTAPKLPLLSLFCHRGLGGVAPEC